MKNWIAALALMLAMAGGCAKDSKKSASVAPLNGSVTDITSPSPAYTPAPQPMTATPSYSDTPALSSSSSIGTSVGSNYKVKKGDTLWSIAKTNYGDGKQYTKIVSANPGLSAKSLKVGQTLVIP